MTEEFTRSKFLIAGRAKTTEDRSTENKLLKDNKKDAKQIMKTNKEVFEDLSKLTADASSRMEGQLTKIGNEINQSNKVLQDRISTLAKTLQELLAPLTKQTQSQRPTTGQKEVNHPSQLNLIWTDTPNTQDNMTPKITQEQSQRPSLMIQPKPSQTPSQSQDSQKTLDPAQKVQTSPSTQEEDKRIQIENDKRISMLESRLKLTEEELQTIKDKVRSIELEQSHQKTKPDQKENEPQTPSSPKPKPTTKPPVLLPHPEIDMDGNVLAAFQPDGTTKL